MAASLATLVVGLTLLGTPAWGTDGETTPGTVRAAAGRAAPTIKIAKKWERRVLKLTNQKRKKHGCKRLRANSKLRKAARRHSKKMARARTLSHRLPGEAALGKRITRAGYRNWRMVGENVAYGYSSPKKMVRAWMQSAGHRKNILRCSYRHLGVGVVKRGGTPWATQDFGRK